MQKWGMLTTDAMPCFCPCIHWIARDNCSSGPALSLGTVRQPPQVENTSGQKGEHSRCPFWGYKPFPCLKVIGNAVLISFPLAFLIIMQSFLSMPFLSVATDTECRQRSVRNCPKILSNNEYFDLLSLNVKTLIVMEVVLSQLLHTEAIFYNVSGKAGEMFQWPVGMGLH